MVVLVEVEVRGGQGPLEALQREVFLVLLRLWFSSPSLASAFPSILVCITSLWSETHTARLVLALFLSFVVTSVLFLLISFVLLLPGESTKLGL